MDDKFKTCKSIWPNNMLFILSLIYPTVPETRPIPDGYEYGYKILSARFRSYRYTIEFQVLSLPIFYPTRCRTLSVDWMDRAAASRCRLRVGRRRRRSPARPPLSRMDGCRQGPDGQDEAGAVGATWCGAGSFLSSPPFRPRASHSILGKRQQHSSLPFSPRLVCEK